MRLFFAEGYDDGRMKKAGRMSISTSLPANGIKGLVNFLMYLVSMVVFRHLLRVDFA